jgi:hypothetical protein
MGVIDSAFSLTPTGDVDFLNTLFRPKKLKDLQMVTEMDPNLIFDFSCLRLIGDRWHSRILNPFAEQYYIHQVAKDRKGRIEAVEVSVSRRPSTAEEE